MKHLIVEIHFIPGDDDGSPLSCVCKWEGTVQEWADHRGALARNIRRDRALGPALENLFRDYPSKGQYPPQERVA